MSPEPFRAEVLYRTPAEFKARLAALLQGNADPLPVRDWVAGYDWATLAPAYDAMFEGMLTS